jgi:hypothetical protein
MKTILAAILALTGATGALAQGFEGAEISAEIRAQTDDFDLGSTVYSGGLQFGITPNIAVAAGFSHYGFRALDANGSGYDLHALYRLGSSGTTLGLFLGNDSIEGTDTRVAGVEAARRFAGIDLQGYLGAWDSDTGGGTLFGAQAEFDFARAFTLSGSFDSVAGATDTSRLAIGAAYRIGNGPQVFAELGRLNADTDDGAFITLGARIGLGPQGGTTFGQRGLLESRGGF